MLFGPYFFALLLNFLKAILCQFQANFYLCF